MTTNKPEVVAWYTPDSKLTLPVVAFNARSRNGQALIRLSDYEALQADRDQQYDMKVKARKQRDEVTAKLSAMQAECEQLRRDAARYRWLRKECQKHTGLTIAKCDEWSMGGWSGDDPDAAIDTAMQEGRKP